MKDNFQTKLEDIETRVKEVIVKLLEDINDSLDLDSSFLELGINSILAVELVESINKRLGIDLGIEVVFDYRGISELAEFILNQYGGNYQPNLPVNSKFFTKKSRLGIDDIRGKEKVYTNHSTFSEDRSLDIAIVGISGRFANSETIEEFWQHLQAGDCCIEEINRKGWKESEYYDPDPSQTNKSISKWGGFLKNIDSFDPLFFNISPQEAERMDPQQRLFMEEAFKAFEDGGYCTEQLSGKKVGVFVAGRTSDYKDRSLHNDEINSQIFLGTDMSMLSARIGYFLNLHGPSLTVDTACSSSLVAIHLACNSLRNKESEIALAGGVFVLSSPEFYVMTSKTNMLSPDGMCKTFDNTANGIVIGEGIGALVLKRLGDAIEDGDHIYGVIKGSAINQDGRTKGITAPSMLSQKALIYEVYKNASINPETISYIEAHGTGTKLGDPIEIKALSEAFHMFTHKNQFCAIGSHKPNFGHTIMSAGIGGVFKILMAMKYRKIPPAINIEKANEHIDFIESPFFINTELCEWKSNDGFPLRAGVSSFGFSGTNCHVIIEEPPIQKKIRNNQCKPYYLFPFSAKTDIALSKKLVDMAKWLEKEGENYLVEDISYTLLMGRSHYSVRHAFIAKDIEELKQRLIKVNENGITKKSFRYREERSYRIDTIIQEYGEGIIKELNENDKLTVEVFKEKLLILSELYVSNYDLNWRSLYEKDKYNKVALPTYPFSRESYWIPEIGKYYSLLNNGHIAYIHPLLHQNTSNLSEQRFSSTFTGQEFFFTDHIVKGQRVLPGVAYLEMARAAVDLAAGALEEGQIGIRLKNVIWARPIAVGDQPVQVHIGLYPEDNGEIAYEIFSETEAVDAENVVHSQGSAVLSTAAEVPALDLLDLQAQCSQSSLSFTQCYEAFKGMGIEYGPGHQGIEKVYVGLGQVLAKLAMPSSVSETQDQFVLHPSLMDSALQASIGLLGVISDTDRNTPLKPSLPFALEELEVLGKCTSTMWALIRYSEGSKVEDKVQKLDLDLCDDQGNVCVRMKGFSTRVLDGEVGTVGSVATLGTLMLQPSWTEQAIVSKNTIPDYTEHLVMLCESEVSRENIESQMNGVRCLSLQCEPKGIEERFQNYAALAFEEIQSILKDKSKGQVLIQIIVSTEGEQQLFSGLSGLLKTAQLENPKLIGQLIGVESGEDTEGIIEKLKENSQSPMDKQIRYQDGKRYVAGWSEIEVSQETMDIPWKDHGIYLITGGAGGLGLIFAKEIAHKVKDSTLILAGRSPLKGDKQAQLMELEALGARIEYKQVDVTQKEAVVNLIQSIQEDFGSLHGIIHGAGVIRDNFILKKTKEELQEVLAPKVTGLVNLDQASKDLSLDFFIAFSSIAGAMGNMGQADYSTANAFMDAYARYRNTLVAAKQRQGQTLSMNWPLWKEGGMHIDQETEKMMMQSMGMVAMQTSTGIRAVYQGLASGKDQVMVMEGNLTRMKQKLLSVATPAAKPQVAYSTTGIDTGNLLDKLQAALIQVVAKLLKVKIEEIDVDAELNEYGFDPIMLTEFAKKLNQEYKLELNPVIFFEKPTLHRFSEYLIAEYQDIFIHRFHMETPKTPTALEKNKAVLVIEQDLLQEKAINYFKELLSSVIKLPANRIEADAPMEKYGIDSIMIIKLTNQLEKKLGSLSKTLFFEYQNIKELTGYFLETYRDQMTELLGIEEKTSPTEGSKDCATMTEPVKSALSNRRHPRFATLRKESLEEKRTVASDIAIIGVSGRYPQAKNIQEYWKNLRDGKDCITEIPKDRWDHSLYFDEDKNKLGKTYSKWGGFLESVDQFDPLFFNISPREAEIMDPQERLFLECVFATLEDAGYTRETLGLHQGFGLKGNVGVYVGVMYEEYQLYGAQEQIQGRPVALSGNPSSIANRVSYFCNFHGPSMAVDTMCSSSLTAIHLACQSLQRGECELAIAGGVNVSIHPNKYLMLGQGRFVSSKGRCESFGQGGDGYVPGEGVGAVLLKPLSKAISDGDHIYGIIKGTAINHGGKTNGYTVPNPNAQAGVIGRALKEAGIDPRTISYLEAHGTGTSLGDPIEIAGLNKTFQKYTKDKQFCAIGSVKSNIGHCESAAGIAGVTKILLQLKYRQLVPSLHSEVLNPNIDFGSTPFIVQQELAEWKRPVVEIKGETKEYPRIAGISAFGAGGANAHVVIEEYIPKNLEHPPITITPQNPAIIVLSAKNEERLQEQVKQLLEAIGEQQYKDASLADMAYTLQVGREAMEERLAMIVGSIKELEEKLKGFVEGQDGIEDLYRGQVKRNKETLAIFVADEDAKVLLQTWIQKRKLKKVAELWVKGLNFDWNTLYGENKPRRISLPTYPFARKRYWVPKIKTKSTKNIIVTPVMENSKDSEENIQTSDASNAATFATSGEQLVGTSMLSYVWDVVPVEKGQTIPSSIDQVMIVGGTEESRRSIQEHYPEARVLDIQYKDTIEEIAYKLEVQGSIDHIIWIAPHHFLKSLAGDTVIEEQNQGVIQVFRMIKALLHLGYGSKDLGWSVLTTQAQPIRKKNEVNPTHASVHGLIGSMAKEYPNWKVRIIDLEAGCNWPITDIFALPADPQGNAWAYRGLEWYRQKLIPVQGIPVAKSMYKTGGVYVVIGGAGGIGEVWSDYMIRTYQAQIIWIGRRQKDAVIQAKLDKLASIGPVPHYIAADATDQKALEQACTEIKERYDQINGVIHSAIVLLDQSLAKMDEERFQAGLSAKVDVSVRIAQVFNKEPLDFVMFFSSLNSFIKAAGQSNYASGCTFKDAFAHQLSQEWPCAVKVINWGYWGSVGIVSSKAYQDRMAQAGIGSIEPPEAMEALEILLAGPMNQIALMKITKPLAMEGGNLEELITVYPENLSSSVQNMQSQISKQDSKIKQRISEEGVQIQKIEDLLCRLLLSQLQSIGLFRENNSVISDLKTKSELRDLYDRWLEESIVILTQKNYLKNDGLSCSLIDTTPIDIESVWKEWDQQKGPWLEDPKMKAQVILTEAVIRVLPEILTGKRLATDIMFPNSSMELVEGIYKNNPVADYFNEVLADTVVAYLKERLQQDPNTQIRILEIGAGTGGTSAMVFQKLKPYQEHIQEYCYTDISKAFLMHAQKEYGQENLYLTYHLFNVEEPVAEQDIRAGEYDIIIAANVLHATKNIRQTLRNAKAVLRKNGLILLNELTSNSLFSHLTFGLLEGWWLHEDSALRIQGFPGLSSETWQVVLESEGFKSIFYPAQDDHELGLQIIVAESDGVVRQKRFSKSTKEYSNQVSETKNFIKISPKVLSRLSNQIKENLIDSCGIPILKAFQILGYFKEIDQKIDAKVLYKKFSHKPNLDKILNTMLNILENSNLIEVQEDSMYLSRDGNSIKTLDRLKNIESRFDLLTRSMPKLSSYLSLVKYCINNYPAILNAQKSHKDLLESKPALNWMKEIFNSLYYLEESELNEYYTQIVSQVLKNFNNIKLTIVDLGGWMGNPISRIIINIVNNEKMNSEYFCLEGGPELKELIHRVYQDTKLLRDNNHHVNVSILRNEGEILRKNFLEKKADLIIIQGDLYDVWKLESQLSLASEIINPNGLILLVNYPILSEFTSLTFGLIEERLLYQTEPNLSCNASNWSSAFNKYGYRTESLFGDWLVLAWHNPEKNTSSFLSKKKNMEVISNSDVIDFLIQSLSSLLGIPQKDLDIDTNFQDYGLDSILISRAYLLIKNAYGEILDPQDMVSHTTIKQLADKIERQKNEVTLIAVPCNEEHKLRPEASHNVDRIDYKFTEVETYSNNQREDVTIEMPKAEELTEKTKIITIRFDENSIQTDLIKVSSNREYEIITSGEGPAIVFLTGLAFTWKIWRHQISILREKFRLIFPHFPGHGASVAEDGKFTFEDLSDDLIDILNYYNIDSAHLVGWCMGGNIAQMFASRYPEKLKSLILVGTTPTDARIRGLNKEDLTHYSVNPLDSYDIEFRNCLRNSPFRDYLLKLYLEYLRDSYCKVDTVYVINYITNLFNFDSLEVLKNINVPTLVIAGKLDIAFPAEQVKLLHQGIAGSKYIEFGQSGHLPFLTQNDMFNNEILKFLTVKKKGSK